MSKKSRRIVRHARAVAGVSVNGRPFVVPEEHACGICSSGQPGFRLYESDVECVSVRDVARVFGRGRIVVEGLEHLGLK